MFESMAEGKVQKYDFSHPAADGESNAVGAVQEYEVVGQEQGGRTNNTDFTIYHTHQQECAGGFAAGTAKFASLPNKPLKGAGNKPFNPSAHELKWRTHGLLWWCSR
jgi:hypothetical protein